MASRAQRSRLIVFLDSRQERIIFEKPTQTASMVSQSVVAPVELANHNGDQLALHLPQARRRSHGMLVDRKVSFEPGDSQGVHLQNVVHPTMLRISVLAIEFRQASVSCCLFHGPDPGHDLPFVRTWSALEFLVLILSPPASIPQLN